MINFDKNIEILINSFIIIQKYDYDKEKREKTTGTQFTQQQVNDKRQNEGHDGKRFHAIGHLWLSLHRRHYRRQSIYRSATINGPCVHRLTSTIVERAHHHGIAEFLAMAT